MNMRWASMLLVLSALAAGAVAAPAWAQDGAAAPVGPPAAFATPQGAPAAGAAPMAMPAQAYAALAAASPPGMPANMPPRPIAHAQSTNPDGTSHHAATFLVPTYSPAAGYPQAPMYPVMQAAYMAGAEGMQPPAHLPAGPMPDVNGSYGYAPADVGAGYGPPGYGPPGYGPGGGYGAAGGMPYGAMGGQPMAPMYDSGYGGMSDGQSMDGGCPICGGQGCPQCGGHGGLFGHGTGLPNGLLGDVLGLVAPYPDGGCAAVRWFDFAVDYMMLKRDNTGRSDQVFSTFGITGPPALNANQLDFGSYKPGFRFSAALQIGPANSLEFTYFGQFNYVATATVRSPGNLFSVFSQFGLLPFGGGGFSEFDNADFNQIRYISSFDSFEVNWRNRWMAPNCRYQGSWTLGVRHFILDEKLRFTTSSAANGFATGTGFVPARSQDDTDTTNNLTGMQVGTDLWVCLLPGLRAGGELQAGVYGNHMNINTTIGSNLVGPIGPNERLVRNDVSFIGQANLLLTYRLNYQWTLRGGYNFLFVDGVALAPENFNPVPPNFNNPFNPHTHIINDNGSVFYHGWNVGLEFMW
jgi:hypothetical protein